MLDITDRTYTPTVDEIEDYIQNPLFAELRSRLRDAHSARESVAYSGDRRLLGWNVRFAKGSKTLLRAYPRRGRFAVLAVIGAAESGRVHELLPRMSAEFASLYEATPEGMGQRWLLAELCAQDALYADILKIAELRCASETKAKPERGK